VAAPVPPTEAGSPDVPSAAIVRLPIQAGEQQEFFVGAGEAWSIDALAAGADGTAWIADCSGGGRILHLDPATRRREVVPGLEELADGRCVQLIADGDRLWAFGSGFAAETEHGLVTRFEPSGEVVHPVGNDSDVDGYVAAIGEGAAWSIDGATPSSGVRIDLVTDQVTTFELPFRIEGALAAGEGAIWVTAAVTDPVGRAEATRLARIDPSTMAVTATLDLSCPIGEFCSSRAIAAGEGGIWLLFEGDIGEDALHCESSVVRVDPTTMTVVETIEIPRRRLPRDFRGFETASCNQGEAIVVGGGAVWALTTTRSFVRIDPATNGIEDLELTFAVPLER
jgi:streptogramin lyase